MAKAAKGADKKRPAKTSKKSTRKTSKKSSRDAGGGTDWLAPLEDKVHAAAKAIRKLRQENRDLTADNDELRQRLEKLERTAEKSPAKTGGEDAEAWEQEREDIRARVERITRRLEELLEG